MKLKLYRKALEDALQVVKLDPKNLKGYWRCAQSYLMLDEFTEAATISRKGLAIDPKFAFLRRTFAIAKFALHYEDISGYGRVHFESALDGRRINVNDVYAIVRANLNFFKSSEAAKALANFRRSLGTNLWVCVSKFKVQHDGKLVGIQAAGISQMSQQAAQQQAAESTSTEAQPPTVRVTAVIDARKDSDTFGQTFSFDYAKPQTKEEKENPALRRLSTGVPLTPTQNVIMKITLSEIKRTPEKHFNEALLNYLIK